MKCIAVAIIKSYISSNRASKCHPIYVNEEIEYYLEKCTHKEESQ